MRPVLVANVLRAGKYELVQGPAKTRGPEDRPQNVVSVRIIQNSLARHKLQMLFSSWTKQPYKRPARSENRRTVQNLSILHSTECQYNYHFSRADCIRPDSTEVNRFETRL